MTFKGIVRGKTIELESETALPEGTRVTVDLSAEAPVRKGSPQAILGLVGTLSEEEGELIRAGSKAARRIDPSLWDHV